MAYEIKCVDIDKNSDFNDCRCIKWVGVSEKEGETNKYSPAQMYDKIGKGEEFFVWNNEKRTYLEKAEREGTKYVRTEQNDTKDDNLLKQSSCDTN